MNNIESQNNILSSHSALRKNDTSEKTKTIYEYPEKNLLKISGALKKEIIYGINVLDITPFTKNFKGRMIIYQTHGLIIYPAKFIPQIPQFCICTFSNINDTVLDPFCGSGT
ncbi:MAG TPA: DNA methyltransferase, partial [Candidatus Deferrimicrobium sp.]|nr:DNA methyltransferase [Candidatus Deferrimicrobium sp.]